jgi:hypothetical protein
MSNLEKLETAQKHVLFHHSNADGWITIAKKQKDGKFKQYHYQPEELAEELSNWLGEDVYFSQNTFYKPQRQIENIRQLRSLYIDLDFYLFNYDPSWVLHKLEHEFFEKTIPEPNVIIFSGQGIVLIWLIDPVPYKALPLWQSVQNYLLSELSPLGGESKATDAARIFRIAGSINTKNGAEVKAQFRHAYRYILRDIQHDYLPELNDEIVPPKKKKLGRKKKVAQLFNVYRLHHARLLDLVKLVELRHYDVGGYRETICFLYRYWLCCYTNDPVDALNQTITFNLQFTQPLTNKEVETATRSAEKAWTARNNEEANRIAIEKGYPGAGYNISNKKLINWLDITQDEMSHLKTIIDTAEKNRRKRIANMEMRREQGVRVREEYIKEQRDKTDKHLFNLQQALEVNSKATRKELAELLEVSVFRIDQLKRQLKSL